MMELINNGVLDLYSRFAVHAQAADGWLGNAQNAAQGFSEDYDVSTLPDLGLSAVILVIVAVVFVVLLGVVWQSRKSTSHDAKAREETHEVWKQGGVFAAVVLVIIIFTFTGYNLLMG